jgi:hypothetical protein
VTQNIPLLTKTLSSPFGGTSPFRVAVVFVNKRTFVDQKWGTREPVIFRDAELGVVRLRAFGNYAYRVADSQLFVNTIVGSQGLFETDKLRDFYRDIIVSRLNDLRQVRRRPDRLLRQLHHAAGRGAAEDRRAGGHGRHRRHGPVHAVQVRAGDPGRGQGG